ncbi:ABC-three component system protein [Marinobacter halophilus]|uniref:ABC-three component systems C-terminal domain-containing protein n=1 Tax=Marinobacter halophilus TaxID=1323740 RepID=A0A2T1KE51_9GAMM|nr:ABC-three component system protein [Marinobacter halophilus]PSF08330.1 hypothetical protein C7H08_06460 [Marinobacter halophilus]GGC59709.1 hypothetical protein GCM10011362_05150 [Marinobacter halophilus]
MPTAAGQLLGYQLQLQRALVHLLQSGRGSSVSVEVTGDVAVMLSNGGKLEEEDKSSLISNPVTNKSTDLWKTFYNWINALNDGSINFKKTKFILYANHEGNKGIVDALSDAKGPEEINKCIEELESLFESLETTHPIHSYLSHVLGHKDAFRAIVGSFEFIVGSKTGSEEIHQVLSDIILVPKHHVDYIHDELLGWITNYVMNKIAANKPAIISGKEYKKKFVVLFERVRARELIDFTKEYAADHKDVQEQFKEYPTYLKQLQIIDVEDHEQVSAVSDFLRRKVNADKWIESELIDEASAQEFEENLKSYWHSTIKKLSITEKSLKPEERGQLLYHDCKVRQATIGNQPVLSHFVRGTYHNLTNEKEIGWHESWNDLLKDR